MAGKLTAVAVVAAKQPGRYTDGDGLILHVRDGGSRQWVLRYRDVAGRRRDLGLGSADTVTLATARKLAVQYRNTLALGSDPITAKAEARVAAQAEVRDRTFRTVAASYIEANAPGWRNAKHLQQWTNTLTSYAYPVLGSLTVDKIAAADVLRCLTPIWTAKPETASRVRGRIEAVLDYAKAQGLRKAENVAAWKGQMAHLLPRKAKVRRVRHHPSLPWRQAPAFLAALVGHRGMAALALRFAILTTARTGEVRGMRWAEIDGDVWTVPADRMKAGVAHRVPLAAAAQALLDTVRPPKPQRGGLVFPGARGVPLSDMSLSMLVRGMSTDGLPEGEAPRWRDPDGRPAVPHGFRSSFRMWAGENRVEDREVIERCLAHAVEGDVEAAYQRDDYLARRRPVMEAWAASVAGEV